MWTGRIIYRAAEPIADYIGMVLQFLRGLSERHERLKERIHAFRIPLSPAGQRVMGLVYFATPVIGGYFIKPQAIAQSHKNIGARGEKLATSTQDVSVLEQNKALQTVLDSHNNRKS